MRELGHLLGAQRSDRPPIIVPRKILLRAQQNYYIDAASGNDQLGDGSIAAPWKTRQVAYNWVQQNVDGGGQVIVFNMIGTFTDAFNAQGPIVGTVFVNFIGGTVAQTAAGRHGWQFQFGAVVFLQTTTIGATGAGAEGILIGHDCYVGGYALSFTACNQAKVHCASGAFVQYSAFNDTGNATSFLLAESDARCSLTMLVAASASPAYSVAFINCNASSAVETTGFSKSGVTTGPRYLVSTGAYINADSESALPGDVAGIKLGGYYVVATPGSSVRGTGKPACETAALGGWVLCDFAGGVAASFNVSSITDGGVGIVTVNWTVPFTSANYAVVATVKITSSASTDTLLGLVNNTNQLAGSVRIDVRRVSDGALTDGNSLNVMAAGAQ